MQESLKRRLVGASVLAVMTVILVPMLLEEKPVEYQQINDSLIPVNRHHPIDVSKSTFVSKISGHSNAPLTNQQPPQPIAMPLANQPKITAPTAPKIIQTPPSQPTPQTDTNDGWVIQVGSFSQHSNAQKVKQGLEKENQPVMVQSIEIDGRKIYRVLIGVLADKDTAKKTNQQLKHWFKRLGLQGHIKPYHP